MTSEKLCDACGLVNAIDAERCVRCGSGIFSLGSRAPDRPQPGPSAPPVYPSATEGTRDEWYAAQTPPPAPVPSPWAPVTPPLHCPHCRTAAPPVVKTRLSQTGVIVMIVLAVTCLPLFWIGFFFREEYRVCSGCGLMRAPVH